MQQLHNSAMLNITTLLPDKMFHVGDQVVVLEKDSTHKTFARWKHGKICPKVVNFVKIAQKIRLFGAFIFGYYEKIP